MVDLWFRTQAYSSPMGGRALPCPGSVGEQPAPLMDAFDLIEAKEAGRDA